MFGLARITLVGLCWICFMAAGESLILTGETGLETDKMITIRVIDYADFANFISWTDARTKCSGFSPGMYDDISAQPYPYKVLRDSMNKLKWPSQQLAWFGAIKASHSFLWQSADSCASLSIDPIGTSFTQVQCTAMNMTSTDLQLFAIDCHSTLPYICLKEKTDFCAMDSFSGNFDAASIDDDPNIERINFPFVGSSYCQSKCLTTVNCIGMFRTACTLIFTLDPWRHAAQILTYSSASWLNYSYRKNCIRANIVAELPPTTLSSYPCGIVDPPTVTTVRTTLPATSVTDLSPSSVETSLSTDQSSTTPYNPTSKGTVEASLFTSLYSTVTYITDNDRLVETSTATQKMTSNTIISDSSTSTATSTSSSTTQLSIPMRPVHISTICKCGCKKIPELEIFAIIEQIKKELTIDTKTTSASIRKRTSAEDDRKSSKAVGVLAIGLCSMIFGLVAVLDLLNIAQLIMKRK